MTRTDPTSSTPKRTSSVIRLLLSAAAALALGGAAGFAMTACGSDDTPTTTPAVGAEIERTPRSIVVGQPEGESLAARALVARDVPPTIDAPTAPPTGERVTVDEVFADPAPRGDGANADEATPPAAKPAAARPGTPGAAPPKGVDAPRGATSQLKLVDAKIATHVASREPEGVADAFDLDVGKLWAWVRVANDGPPTQITMIWRRDGEVASTHQLDVGKSAGWRTWSRRTVRKWDAGAWTVEVLDADGVSLGTLEFAVRDATDGDAT